MRGQFAPKRGVLTPPRKNTMLDIKFIRQNYELVREALNNRHTTVEGFDTLLAKDDRRREILGQIEELRAQRNQASADVAKLKKSGADASQIMDEMRNVGDRIKALETGLETVEKELGDILYSIPNVPSGTVPVGKDENDNPVLRTVGTPRQFDFTPQAHWDIAKNLGILDLEKATQITGARFPLYFGAGARLERALVNFMLDTHTRENGFMETLPPFMVNRASMTATGQLPKFEEDLFKLEGWDYFLIPTAEVPVTNILAGEILNEEDLPLYYTAYTPCFRSEAGSYGKDTRGLIRQHQFNKVELVKFALPEYSYAELESLLEAAESILLKLNIPYRVITLCTGDMGFSSAKTYDIEVWLPSQNCYREISSCSNFEDFQARRANIRFKRKGGKKTEFLHTLNGSGLAVGRTWAAIVENFQQADGSVIIPEVLRPYMGGMEKMDLCA